MCPAAQAKRGAVSNSTSGPKLRQGKGGGVRGRSLVSHFLLVFRYFLGDGAGAHVHWFLLLFFRLVSFIIFHLHVCVYVCVCSKACAQLDVPVSAAAAALRFLSLTGNKVLLSLAPDAAPEGPNTKLSQLGSGFSSLRLHPQTVNTAAFILFLPVQFGLSESEMWITLILCTLKI